MQQRQLLQGILVAVALTVFGIAGVTLWLFTQSPIALLFSQTTLPEIVRLVPRTAPATLVLSQPLDHLEDFVQAAAPPQYRRRTRQTWDRLVSGRGPGGLGDFFGETNVDFRREIQPWLGDETLVALVDLNPASTDLTERDWGYLIAVTTEDLTRSNLFLNVLWQRQELAGQPIKIETYKGVQITSSTFGKTPALSAAAFGDRYVLFADQPQVLREAIDSWQLPFLSLANDPQFQSVIDPLQPAGVGWAYLQLAGDPMRPSLAEPGSLEALGLGLHASFKGLVADTSAVWNLPADRVSPETLGKADQHAAEILKHVPPSVAMVFTGQDLSQIWGRLQTVEPLAGLAVAETLQELEETTQLNWQADLFSWMTSDFALAVLETDIRKSDALSNWILVAEVPEESLPAQQALDQQIRALGLDWRSVALTQPEWGEAVTWIRPLLNPANPAPSIVSNTVASKPGVASGASTGSELIQIAEVSPQDQDGPDPAIQAATIAEAGVMEEGSEDPEANSEVSSDLAADQIEVPTLDAEAEDEGSVEFTEPSEFGPEEPSLTVDPSASSGSKASAQPNRELELPSQTLIYHLYKDGYFYLTPSRLILEAALDDPDLSTSQQWQRSTAILPNANQGYVYIDVQATIPLLTQLFPGSSKVDPWATLTLRRNRSSVPPAILALTTTETSLLDPDAVATPNPSRSSLIQHGNMLISFHK